MTDSGASDTVVVFLEFAANSSVLVDLTGLGNDSGGALVDLARNSLILSNDAVANRLVEVVEEGEEAGRDALFVCEASAKPYSTLIPLTVKVDCSLDDMVSHDVSVGEVLGDNGGLGAWVSGALFAEAISAPWACPLG